MKILIFVDHDIIVRHFLHSHVFDELAKSNDVVLVFPERGNKRIKRAISADEIGGARVCHLPVAIDRLKLWQGLMLADALRWRPGQHSASMRRFHRHAAGKRAAWLYSLLALPLVFQVYRQCSYRRIENLPNRNLDALLDQEAPDILIHPTVLAGVFVNDLVSASGRRSIPLILIMNSWDNPSTKRAMAGRPDWLLVWGPQTRDHAVRFLGMPPERVICFGAAQFDLYRKPPRVSRNEFCAQHDISPGARILLYAGSSKGSDEFSHLQLLDGAISRGELGNTVVVYRPHPWGGGGKGGNRILDQNWRNVRIEQTMRGYLERVKAGDPGITTPDYRHTHDLLSSVDALVSPLSTIIIEGALHGKPVMCFLPESEDSEDHLSLALPFTHFDDLFKEPLFATGRGVNSLVPQLRLLLDKAGDEEFEALLRKACEHFVAPFDRAYGERLAELVAEVATRSCQTH